MHEPAGERVAERPRTGRPPLSPLADPLNAAERDALARALTRVKTRAAAVLATLPGPVSSDAELARVLDLDRVTTYRVARLARDEGETAEILRRAPGGKGLLSFVDACERAGVAGSLVQGLRSAVLDLLEIIETLGGNKARVVRRLEASPADEETQNGDAEREARRRGLARAAAELLGREIGVRADINIFRPSTAAPEMLDHAHARALLGCRSLPWAKPMHVGMVGNSRILGDAPAVFRGASGGSLTGGAVLEEFSTSPPPLVASRGEGDRVRHVIDAGSTDPVDVVVAHETRAAGHNPRKAPPWRLESGAMVRDPVGLLILDVWVDREWAGDREPDLGLYLWGPTLEQGLPDNWLDRLPGTPPIERLPDPMRAGLEASPRHGDLTATLFRQLAWDPSRFTGYRCRVQWPMYGGAYFFSFDFS